MARAGEGLGSQGVVGVQREKKRESRGRVGDWACA